MLRFSPGRPHSFLQVLNPQSHSQQRVRPFLLSFHALFFPYFLRKHVLLFDMAFPGSSVVKNQSAMQETCRRHGFNRWVGKIPWQRKWQPTAVTLPGKSRGQRSLAGCSPWGHRHSDTTARHAKDNQRMNFFPSCHYQEKLCFFSELEFIIVLGTL